MKRARSSRGESKDKENINIDTFPFSDLIEDVKNLLVVAYLDPATRCSFSLTNRHNFQTYYDPKLFSCNFTNEAARYGHIGLLKVLIDDWDAAYVPNDMLLAVANAPQHQSLDTFSFWLPFVQKWIKDDEGVGSYADQLRQEFSEALRSWIAVLPVEQHSHVLSSSFWRDLSISDPKLLLEICTELIAYDCFDFIRLIIDTESKKRRSLWMDAVKELHLSKHSLARSSIDRSRWYLQYQNPILEDEQLERELVRIVFDYGLMGARTGEQLDFILSYVTRYQDALDYFDKMVVWEIAHDVAERGDVIALEKIISQRAVFGIADEDFPEMVTLAFLGALEGYRVEALKFLIPYLKHGNEDEILNVCSEVLFSPDLREEEHIPVTDRIAECFDFVVEKYPPKFRSLLFNYPDQTHLYSYIGLGKIRIFETLLKYNYKFPPDLIHGFLDRALQLNFHFPNRCLPVIEFLEGLPDIIAPNSDEIIENLDKEYKTKFDFTKSICRPEALVYLQYLDKVFGEKIFKKFNEKSVIKCIDFAADERVVQQIRLPVFLEAFKYAFHRSGLSWTKKMDERAKKLKVKYMREEFAKMIPLLKH